MGQRFGENLANSNKSVFVSTDQFIVAQTPLRPRVIGLQLGISSTERRLGRSEARSLARALASRGT